KQRLAARVLRWPGRGGLSAKTPRGLPRAPPSSDISAELRSGRRDNRLRREPELFLELFEWSGGAEGGHSHAVAARPYVASPSEGRRLLDGDARSDVGGQDARAVIHRLLL